MEGFELEKNVFYVFSQAINHHQQSYIWIMEYMRSGLYMNFSFGQYIALCVYFVAGFVDIDKGTETGPV